MLLFLFIFHVANTISSQIFLCQSDYNGCWLGTATIYFSTDVNCDNYFASTLDSQNAFGFMTGQVVSGVPSDTDNYGDCTTSFMN